MGNKYDVGYGTLDAFKRQALTEARKTDGNIERLGLKVVDWSRGESVFLVEHDTHYEGHVNEGLGTKNDAADVMSDQLLKIAGCLREHSETSNYDKVAQCTLAMIVNDTMTLGALPTIVYMHLAVAKSDWFEWGRRNQELVSGWKKACDMARCVWGGGETPALRDLIIPGKAVISGSANCIVKPKGRLIRRNIQDGDAILLLESSGIHANGLTFARDLAAKLPEGYLTRMPDGRTYGETLLDPTHIYVGFIEDCLNAGIEIHYGVNITGHGWRKLMRAPESFEYHISRLPSRRAIFDFLEKHGDVKRRDMFADFNMGAGFALYMPELSAAYAMDLLQSGQRQGRYPFGGLVAGSIGKASKSRVFIQPENIAFEQDELQVR